ncbi:MAG: lipopolysaccharide export system permease protein [Planctomycetota bacterium]|jgi:lipopolysaccharide export system permease protein
MRLVQRYLTKALTKNGTFTFLVLASIISMMVFSMVALRESMSFLTFEALLQVVALLATTQLQVLIPLTALTAAIWTYSRFQSNGELTAMRGAGVSLRNLLIPALFMGTVATMALILLQNKVIPEAHYTQRVIGKRFLAASIDRFLDDDRKSIQDRRFKCRWDRVARDSEGHPVLVNFSVAELGNGEDQPPVFTRAKRAEPWIDMQKSNLILELKDVTYATIGASQSMRIILDLAAISEEPAPRRKTKHLAYDELFTSARRYVGTQEALKSKTELHGRAATAFSALLFSVLGALLGMIFELRNRAYVFVVGFLLVLTLHYAPSFVGHTLGKNGTLSPALSMWLGNVAIGVTIVFAARKARHR